MLIGASYYPEHWGREMWEKEAEVMKKTGIGLVRLAEFAWGQMEAEEGSFSFEWLDYAINLFQDYGIKVILGTPTSAPPNWLVEKYPNVLLRDAYLHPRYQGARGHRCVNSSSLRERTKILVEEMGKRYGEHPNVIGWQIDNEFEMTLCNCDTCNTNFRLWLKDKYKTLDNLNREWGTVFWSGEYRDWKEVHSPLGGQRQLNPSFQLDYYRFQNQSITDYQQLQIDIIRKYSDNQFITHNMWESPLPLNYYKYFENLDFASIDYYPSTNPADLSSAPYRGAFLLDYTRGIKRTNFWVMEQLSGTSGGCWGPMNRTPKPGMLRAYTWQVFSRGADTAVYFNWKQAPMGSEQLGQGVFDNSHVKERKFFEIVQTCGELNRLSQFLENTYLKNNVAILYSNEQHRAFQIQTHIKGGVDYKEILELYHQSLVKLGVGIDVINWIEDLSQYRLVIAPYLFLMNDQVFENLRLFVESGGILILTNRSGVKHMNNQIRTEPLPGNLSDLTGTVVEEWDPIVDDIHFVEGENGKVYECQQWCDILKILDSRPIAWYKSDYYKGKPAVSLNKYGNGEVYYLGTNFKEDYLRDLFINILKKQGISYFSNLPEGIHFSIRQNENNEYLFLINLSLEEKILKVDREYRDLITDKDMGPVIRFDPFDVTILSR